MLDLHLAVTFPKYPAGSAARASITKSSMVEKISREAYTDHTSAYDFFTVIFDFSAIAGRYDMKKNRNVVSGHRLRLAREIHGLTQEDLIEQWRSVRHGRLRLPVRVATVSEWERLGLPGKKVALVAEFFGAPGYLFLDAAGVSDETFIARIEQAKVSAQSPQPPAPSRYEEILASYKDSDDLPAVLMSNGFGEGRIVEYAANELNKTEYRKKSINVLFGLNPTEEQLYRIASSDNAGRLSLNNNFLRMFDEGQFEFLKRTLSQRIAECLFRHRYNKLIHVVNYLVNTAGAIKTDVFRHAVYFRQISSRKLAIASLFQQNDHNRLAITWLLKDGMEDSWGLRDEIGFFVTNLVEHDAFYNTEEEQTAEKLLDWVLHKAKWKVDKPYKENFEAAYVALRKKRSE